MFYLPGCLLMWHTKQKMTQQKMGRCVRDWWEETAESVEGGTG